MKFISSIKYIIYVVYLILKNKITSSWRTANDRMTTWTLFRPAERLRLDVFLRRVNEIILQTVGSRFGNVM